MARPKSSMPEVAIEPMTEEEKELQTIEAQRTKIIDGIKSKLEQHLKDASEKVSLLQRLGEQQVLGGSQFSKYCNVLGIASVVKLPISTRGLSKHFLRGRRRKKTVNDAVLEALGSGKQMGVLDITSKVSAILGKTVKKPSVNQSLMKLKKLKSIKNPSRGQYVIK